MEVQKPVAQKHWMIAKHHSLSDKNWGDGWKPQL